MLNVITVPDPILRSCCTDVVQFDQHLVDLVEDMKKTMNALNGVGIAAPQVGINKNIIVAQNEVLINPVIINYSTECSSLKEGCLSVPGKTISVWRPKKVSVKYKDVSGKEYNKEFSGLLAKIVQHEIDHLHGVLIIDRVQR